MKFLDDLSLTGLDALTGQLMLLCDVGHRLASAGLAPVFDLTPGEEGIIRLPVIVPGLSVEGLYDYLERAPASDDLTDIVIEPKTEQAAPVAVPGTPFHITRAAAVAVKVTAQTTEQATSPEQTPPTAQAGGPSVGEGGRSSTQPLPDAPENLAPAQAVDATETIFDSPIVSPRSVAVSDAAEVPQDTKPEVEAPAVVASPATAGAALPSADTGGLVLGPLTDDERNFIAAHAQLGWKSAMIAEALNRKVQTIGLFMSNLPKPEAPEVERVAPAPAPVAADPAPVAAPGQSGAPMTPLLTHLFGLPTKGWTTAQDHELMELCCTGWGYNELQVQLKRAKADLVARFDLLTGLYRDANDKQARRFKREDVLVALASLLPAQKLE
ncbi:MAG: hypothetical protein V4712_15170 [Pseudomonadota bacterium]